MLSANRPRRKFDPSVALIDVVFQMLVFFMVGGQLAPQLAKDLELVATEDLDAAPPPDALVLHADGALSFRGLAVEAEPWLASLPEEETGEVRIVADRAVPALRLVEISTALRAAGAGAVILVTAQALTHAEPEVQQ